MDLGSHEVDRPERGTGAGELTVGCGNDDVMDGGRRPGEEVEPDRVDPVVATGATG